ncbi:Uncharacterised protein [uncultured archaeon]|nr:Uncharacterised protein [uncultured archaeon]
MAQKTEELPFSARYALPAQLADKVGEVSWETVAQLSTEFQLDVEDKSSKVKKVIKELQMSRLLLMDRIRHGSRDGKIDPQLLVDAVRLVQRAETVAKDYDLDLHDFSTFLYLISEKLKKEKLARHDASIGRMAPIQDEIAAFKMRSEPTSKTKKARKGRKKK